MELTVHPLLTLVEDNANGRKLLLKNYIDFTVEKQFDKLKNSIGEMIATGQIGPQHNESSLPYTQNTFPTDQSNIDTPNSSILQHFNEQLTITSEQITLPCLPLVSTITTSPVIKQEYLEDSSTTTIPINVPCNDAPNDDDNDQSNSVGISVNDGQNGRSLIDEFNEVKEEYDDEEDEKEGELMSESDECEDCVKGICQLNHLVRENANTNSDAPNVSENDHLENNGIYSSVQGRVSQDEFVEEDIDDDMEDLLLPIDQQNNDLSNASIVPPTMYHENDQLITDQITLPLTNQRQTSTKQSNSNLNNHNEDEDLEDCLDEIKEKDEDDETDEQIEINQDDEESSQQVQRLDSTQTINGQAQDKGLSPIQTKQVNSQIECDEPVIQQSIPSTSGLRSSSRKRIPTKLFGDEQSHQVKNDKRKSKNNSGKAVQKVKHEDAVDEIHHEVDKEEAQPQIVTLELNCTEPGCEKILKSREMWREHLSTCHGKIAFKQFKDNVRHNQHGQIEYPCNECLVVCISQLSLYIHWRDYHLPGKYECSLCEFVANFRSEFRNHTRNNHRSSKYKCTHQECNKVFICNHDLQIHQRIHSGERPFVCIWTKCKLTFNNYQNAICHVRTKHFHLPRTVKKQQELNIIDTRDPKVFVKVNL